jgi:GTP pyrophosphokinase
MSRPDIRFSPTEKRALEFAAAKHKGISRMGGQEYIAHPIVVAEYLYDHGYRGKYVFTALFHDLLEDTSTTEQDIFELGGRFTRDAVILLTKKKGTDIADYLAKIKKTKLRMPSRSLIE